MGLGSIRRIPQHRDPAPLRLLVFEVLDGEKGWFSVNTASGVTLGNYLFVVFTFRNTKLTFGELYATSP